MLSRVSLPVIAAVMVAALIPVSAAEADPGRNVSGLRGPVSAPLDPRALNPTNPLLAGNWGVYLGPQDQLSGAYQKANGKTRKTLGKIALKPRAAWFGQWLPTSGIAQRVRSYISSAQAGDPNAIVQLAVFSMSPWEGTICKRLPTAGEQKAYYAWTDQLAAGIGNSRVAIVLQPDGPFANCTPGGSKLPSQMISYSAQKLSALPNAAVYVDAGAADWPPKNRGGVKKALEFLIPGGVQYTRGIALNSTHYSSTTNEVKRGSAIVAALAKRGITGKHVVINTSNSGKPFVFGNFRGTHPDNAPVCRSRKDRRTCVMLGIPPTWNVSSKKWGLSPSVRRLAAANVDGYLWFGRPWLNMQADPFVMKRALGLARHSRF